MTERIITKSACSTETVWGSKEKRLVFSSPACGPLPVTIVPRIRTPAVTNTCARIKVVCMVSDFCVWIPTIANLREAAPEIRSMESSKWAATGIGLRSVNTVIPPSIP